MKRVKTVLNPAKSSTKVEDLLRNMRQRVIGQDEAIVTIADAFETFLAGFHAPHRPVCNMIMLGPTGTGKTRVVESAAESLFGDERALLKVNCAEFQHSHEIAKLIGSPPGYLGHRETHAALSQEALNRWWTSDLQLSFVLFDEIEKASDAVWQLLLGILDKGELTLGDNRKVDFSKAMIFMTSNVGAMEMQSVDDDDEVVAVANRALRKTFSPEFVNRIDRVAVFKTLRLEQLQQILELELGKVQQRILQNVGNTQFVFACDTAVRDVLIEEGFDPRYGARHLKRVIERRIVFPMAKLVSTGQVKRGDFVQVSATKGGFRFTKTYEDAPLQAMLDKFGHGKTATA